MSDQFRAEPPGRAPDPPPALRASDFAPLPEWLAARLLRPDEEVTWVRGPRRCPSWERHVTHPGVVFLGLALGATFLLAGRYYEARARSSAASAMRKLAAAAARDVCVLGPDGRERRIPAGQLRHGDTFVVRPGEKRLL